jgi:hypothetical protein
MRSTPATAEVAREASPVLALQGVSVIYPIARPPVIAADAVTLSVSRGG